MEVVNFTREGMLLSSTLLLDLYKLNQSIRMTIEAPTILGSLSFAGSAPSSVPGNLTWSDDGQAAFFTSRGIHIVVRPRFSISYT